MEKLFSTDDVHPRDRFDYWHTVACRNFVDHESEPRCFLTFRAELEAGAFGGIDLVLFENAPMKVRRTARQTARSRTEDLFVCRQMAGALLLEQEGRELLLEPGDITLVDPMLPHQGEFRLGSRILVLKIRRQELEARLGNTREFTARALKPMSAEIGFTSSFLAMLPIYAGRLDSAAERIASDQALDLIAVSFAKAMQQQGAHLSSPRTLVLLNLYAAIEARLHDPALDSKTAAAIAGVSVRYANAVLAKLETSIARLIQSKRLARCRRALEDPAQGHRTLSEIAYGWGFSDMTHFGRTFKKTYGALPSDYRRMRKKVPDRHSDAA